MSVYWSVARVGEHPAAARLENWSRDAKLSDVACRGFRSRAALAGSERLSSVVMAEEDAAGTWEVVCFQADSATEQVPDASGEGVFVDVFQIDERTPIIAWLEATAASSDEAAAAATQALTDYREVRSLVDE